MQCETPGSCQHRCASVLLDTQYAFLLTTAADDPYTLEHFREPRVNSLVVRPLVDRLYSDKDISMG